MTELSEQTSLAVLGAGKMEGALLGGLIARGWCLPAETVVTARRPERLEELEPPSTRHFDPALIPLSLPCSVNDAVNVLPCTTCAYLNDWLS